MKPFGPLSLLRKVYIVVSLTVTGNICHLCTLEAIFVVLKKTDPLRPSLKRLVPSKACFLSLLT